MAKKDEQSTAPQSDPIEGIEDTDYDAAFDAASNDVSVADLETGSAVTGDEIPPTTDEDEVTPPTGDTPAGDEPTGDAPTGDVPPSDQPPAPSAAETALTRRVAELEGQLAQQTKPDAPTATPPEPTALSAEDQEAVTETQEDWPTIYRTMEVKIGQLEARIAQLIDDKVGAVQTQLQPVVKQTQETAQDKFLAAIEVKHPGAKALLPSVEKWIETKPSYVQSGMNNVLDRGSAAQVIELYDQWKAETKPADEQATTPPAADPNARRLASMEGVRTERTGVSTDDDPSDFDSAFDKAAAS